MTHDPETAERLVAILKPLITEQSCGEWDDKTINEDVQKFLPLLLAALQAARNAALREAANIVRGEVYLKHYRTWVIWPPYDDLPQERPNVSENHGKARHCDQLADAILALIDTPAPPAAAESAGGELREALVRLLQIITRNGSLDDGRTLHEVIADALLAAGWTRKREEG